MNFNFYLLYLFVLINLTVSEFYGMRWIPSILSVNRVICRQTGLCGCPSLRPRSKSRRAGCPVPSLCFLIPSLLLSHRDNQPTKLYLLISKYKKNFFQHDLLKKRKKISLSRGQTHATAQKSTTNLKHLETSFLKKIMNKLITAFCNSTIFLKSTRPK